MSIGLVALLAVLQGQTPRGPQPPSPALECGSGKLRVEFFDVGQGLAVLVELPDHKLILVDTGDSPSRTGCGEVCGDVHTRFMHDLHAIIGKRPIDVLWLTHPHSDHVGGAVDVLTEFSVKLMVHNGVPATVFEKALEVANERQVPVRVAGPGVLDDVTTEPLERLTPVLPASMEGCAHDMNNCSAGLRVAYCEASVLFVGDAQEREEVSLDGVDGADVLQVGHHGSNTSSSIEFIQRVNPTWAVISAGHQNEGVNRTYCHPRAVTLDHLTKVLHTATTSKLRALRGDHCAGGAGDWREIDASDHILSTSRDGNIILESTGSGFRRVRE